MVVVVGELAPLVVVLGESEQVDLLEDLAVLPALVPAVPPAEALKTAFPLAALQVGA